MTCKNCGKDIMKYHAFYGGTWVHMNGFALCFITDQSNYVYAEPKAVETDG